MNADEIKSMFVGVDDYTKDIIVRKLKNELSTAIKGVNEKMRTAGLAIDQLSPAPPLIMNAFRQCSLQDVRVVIIAQDPFINVGEATGLCFSVPKGVKIPPSTVNIYKCLVQHGLMRQTPAHGDLSSWAAQGVLMINAALTTILGTSNAHEAIWKAYTDAVLKEISALPRQVIFILLGGFAKKKAVCIDKRRHIIIEWGHPSPVNTANNGDNPKHFKYCPAFTRTNDMLARPIVWDPDASVAPDDVIQTLSEIVLCKSQPAHDTTALSKIDNSHLSKFYVETAAPVITVTYVDTPADTYELAETTVLDPTPLTNDTLWVFTDGGARANGKANCIASWGFYITDGNMCVRAYGRVPPIVIPGKAYKSSNNRGELMAILKAMDYVSHAQQGQFEYKQIVVVSDSEYSINGIDKYSMDNKANVDLIGPAKKLLTDLRGDRPTALTHVDGHGTEDVDPTSAKWFLWKGNDIVDKLCQLPLPPQRVATRTKAKK